MGFIWMPTLALLALLAFYVIDNFIKRGLLKKEKKQAEKAKYIKIIKDVDIKDVCNTAISSIQGRQGNEVQLIINSQNKGHYILKTYVQRLYQVLTNYITNACNMSWKNTIAINC